LSELTQNFLRITQTLKEGGCKEIDGRRVFILSRAAFNMILEIYQSMNWNMEADRTISESGYDNVNLMHTSGDKEVYFVAAKAEAILDRLWQDKAPKKGG
jgi:hypothetical protein